MSKICECGIALPIPEEGALRAIYETILANNWVKQPDLSLSASLVLMSSLISRKVVFQGMSPNLYILNVAPSGSGKDCPQQQVKKMLVDIKGDYLLGAGDYVSDASLMNSLETTPTRLDIMDEMGGILRMVNNGKSDYNSKMADVLAELYTSSNSKYLGRATAEGNKGSCYRPNVNILGSTTPTGFMEGVSLKAIEKGLLGRFLIFQGNPQERAQRLRNFPTLDYITKENLKYWLNFRVQDHTENITESEIGDIPQDYIELTCSTEADAKLDEIFNDFDELRVSSEKNDPMLPIIARLYQQTVKIIIIHACSRAKQEIPTIDVSDVEYGYKLIMYYYYNMANMVKTHVFGNQQEADTMKVLNIIKNNGGSMTKTQLSRSTRSLNKRKRDALIDDLIDSEALIRDVKHIDGKNQVIYYVIGD